jgi:ribosomal-protein-alanine N-acetyltransferase
MNLADPAAPSGSGRLPTIVTERLVLRPFQPTDIDAMLTLTSDRETMRYLGDGEPWTPARTEEMLGRHFAQYPSGSGFGAVADRATGAFAGWAGLQNPRGWMARVVGDALPDDLVEVGWTLAPRWRGRGYATEAAEAWLTYGFGTLGLGEIVAVHDPANAASERVMDRLGMTRREMLRLTDGDTLCLHVTTMGAWEARLRKRGIGSVTDKATRGHAVRY